MTTLSRVVEWSEGADTRFVIPVWQKLAGTRSRVDLTGASIALEVRDKGASLPGSALYLRADSEGETPAITLLPPDEGETAAHRMLVEIPDTTGAAWLGRKGVAEVRVLFPETSKPVPVLRFSVTLTPKIVSNV